MKSDRHEELCQLLADWGFRRTHFRLRAAAHVAEVEQSTVARMRADLKRGREWIATSDDGDEPSEDVEPLAYFAAVHDDLDARLIPDAYILGERTMNGVTRPFIVCAEVEVTHPIERALDRYFQLAHAIDNHNCWFALVKLDRQGVVSIVMSDPEADWTGVVGVIPDAA